jgi:hypothetical protein
MLSHSDRGQVHSFALLFERACELPGVRALRAALCSTSNLIRLFNLQSVLFD